MVSVSRAPRRFQLEGLKFQGSSINDVALGMAVCVGLKRGLEIGEGFDAVNLGGFDQKSDSAPGFFSLAVTRKQGVFPIQGNWADHVLDAVGVNFDAAILEEC